MNKFFVLLIFGLFLLNGIFAVEINMSSEYDSGETLIAKISGEFLISIQKNNIFFYKEHVRAPLDYGLTKIGYDYYLYAVLSGKTEGNYSLSIENVKYQSGGITYDDNVVQNFTITNDTADFSVDQGFINSDNNFSITVKNLKDSQIDVKISTSEFSRRVYIYSIGTKEFSLTLNPGETEKINFVVTGGEEIFQNLLISSDNTNYQIPVYLSGTEDSSPSTSEELGLNFQTSTLIVIIPTNSNYKQIIYLYNVNQSDIQDVTISLSDDLSYYAVLNKETLDIKSNSNESLELSLFSEDEKEIEGYVYAKVGEESISLKVTAEFLQNSSETESPTAKTCSELGGVVCETQTHECDVNLVSGKDGWCCTGTCSEIQENNSLGRIIAIILILGLISFVTWFYFKKYKKSKKPVDLLKNVKKP